MSYGGWCSHEWVDTGMLRTYCKKCDVDGLWCRQKCKYVAKGLAEASVNDPEDRKARDYDRN